MSRIYKYQFRTFLIPTAMGALIFLIFALPAFSQPAYKDFNDERYFFHREKADKYFANEEYYLASKEYEKALQYKPHSADAAYLAGESHRLYFDYAAAEKLFLKALQIADNNYPMALFGLGLVQKINGSYTNALHSLTLFTQTFRAATTDDSLLLAEADFELQGCKLALEATLKPANSLVALTALDTPVNTEYIDFAAAIFEHDSSLVLSSFRPGGKGHKMNLAMGEAKSDNYRFEKKGTHWSVAVSKKEKFSRINTVHDDGSGEFTYDKTKYYYTICNPECAIYVSKIVNGKFKKPKKLNANINPKGYWNAQPSLSPGGDTMLFVSKRPGGKGGDDIWMSFKKTNNPKKEDWQPAQNVPHINTAFNEISPFWDDHSNLIYFASNGHIGFGGFDIFAAKGAKRDSIYNIGLPYNSPADDFYFVHGHSKGYLTSNRKGTHGHHDVYIFNYYPEKFRHDSLIKIKESTTQPLLSNTENPLNAVSSEAIGSEKLTANETSAATHSAHEISLLGIPEQTLETDISMNSESTAALLPSKSDTAFVSALSANATGHSKKTKTHIHGTKYAHINTATTKTTQSKPADDFGTHYSEASVASKPVSTLYKSDLVLNEKNNNKAVSVAQNDNNSRFSSKSILAWFTISFIAILGVVYAVYRQLAVKKQIV